MDPVAFATTIASWTNVFLAEAGASAALLGLLFVGVSINLGAISLAERADLRAKAEQAFSNLLYVLAISLILLGPDSDSVGDAFALGAIALVGLVRVARNILTVRRLNQPLVNRATLRRFGWTVAADLLVGYAALRFWMAADAKAMFFVMVATLVLLIGAADTSWEMLVEVSQSEDEAASKAA